MHHPVHIPEQILFIKKIIGIFRNNLQLNLFPPVTNNTPQLIKILLS